MTPIDAAPHIEAWHYSGAMPKGRNICFGFGHPLFVVAVYGNGCNPYQASYLARVTGLPVDHSNYVELKRLARTDADGRPMSWFLARCHRHLRDLGYIVVVSFSDPERGHTGGLYRACNFIESGKTQAEMHCTDSNGATVHRRKAYRYAKVRGITTVEARVELGLATRKTAPKTRWILPLTRRVSVAATLEATP